MNMFNILYHVSTLKESWKWYVKNQPPEVIKQWKRKKDQSYPWPLRKRINQMTLKRGFILHFIRSRHRLFIFGGAKVEKLGACKKGNIIMAQNSTEKFQKDEYY